MRQIWYIQSSNKSKLDFLRESFLNKELENDEEYGIGFHKIPYYEHMFSDSFCEIYFKIIDDNSILLFYEKNESISISINNDNILDILKLKNEDININRLIIFQDGRWQIFPSKFKITIFSFSILTKMENFVSGHEKIRDLKSIKGSIEKNSVLMNSPKSNLEFLLFEKELFKSIPQIKEFIHA